MRHRVLTLIVGLSLLASCVAPPVPRTTPSTDQPRLEPETSPTPSRLPVPPYPDRGEQGATLPSPSPTPRTLMFFDLRGRNVALLQTTLAWDRRIITIPEHFYGDDRPIPSPVDLYERADADIRRIEAIARIEMPSRVRTALRMMRPQIMDPGQFDGLIVHDIESWGPYFRPDIPPSWKTHETQFLNLLRTKFPQRLRDPSTGLERTGTDLQRFLAAEYTLAAQAWAGELLRETRRQAPHAAQGWYAIPITGYWDASKPDVKAAQRVIHDEQLAWFWPLVDVLCPNAYERYHVIPDGQARREHAVTASDDLRYKRLRAAEVARLVERLGKPDLWYLGLFVYNPNIDESNTPSDLALANTAAVFRDHPPAGVILWGWTSQGQADVITRFNEQIARWETTIHTFRR